MEPELVPPPGQIGLVFDETVFVGTALTLGVYMISERIHRGIGSPFFLNPLIIAILVLSSFLYLADVPYPLYFKSAEAMHLLLSPVVVLLSVPLWRQFPALRELGGWMLPVLLVAAGTGIATSAGLAYGVGLSPEMIGTLAPRSVTTPVAIQISESLGGIVSITAVVVILTGIAGATFGLPLLRLLGFRDARVIGFSVGVSSHAIGTGRMFQIDSTLGAFASLGMIINAIATAILVGIFLVILGPV